uniref:Uncharacterized protein n=1 Tax=Rhizophora mucronata TaxID=61149 RepID=A0A2P2R472_RHIMU
MSQISLSTSHRRLTYFLSDVRSLRWSALLLSCIASID